MIAICALMGLVPDAHAGVTNIGTGATYDDLATAVLDLGGGGSLEVDPGLYLEPEIVIAANITVIGTGPGVVIVNDLSNGIGEIFDVVSSAHLTVENITLTGDYRSVKVTGASIEFTDVTFDWNFAFDFGVAVHATDSSVTLTNVQINHATAAFGGAAIYSNRSDLILTGLVVDGAFSDENGGAISAINSTVACTDCTFMNNVTTEDGGAIHATGTGTLEIAGSTFFANRAYWNGGAIDTDVPTTVTDSSFEGNAARFTGAVEAGESLDVNRSSFCANTADYGGAVYVSTASTFANVTFTNNHSSLTNFGDAIHVASPDDLVTVDHGTFVGHHGTAFMGLGAEVSNSIFANNGTAMGAGAADWTAFFNNDEDGIFGIVLLGQNILQADPDFQDWTDDDTCNDTLWPSWTSPMIDAGTGVDLNSTPADLGATGGLAADPSLWVDADSDNWVMMWDCDNDDSTTYPDAVEIPGNDVDENCDGEVAPAIEDTDPPTDTGTEPTETKGGGGKEEKQGCGCSSSGLAGSWIALFATVVLVRRKP